MSDRGGRPIQGPTEAEVEVALREILECWEGNRRHDKTMAYVVVAAVLPLYRDRLLTELADEIDEWTIEPLSGATQRWLRSKRSGGEQR